MLGPEATDDPLLIAQNMPKAEATQVILELTQHVIRALRAVNGTVEAGGECALENKPALEALLDAVAPTRKADGLKAAVAIWPGSAGWHLSSDTEAMLDRSDESIRAIAAGMQKGPAGPLAYAACNADDGGRVTPEGTQNWILASSSRESMARTEAALSELKVTPESVSAAAFATLGAVAKALTLDGKGGAVALWDLGWGQSHILIVTEKGVEATAPCDIGMDAVFEAVQASLRLKFRGAGARLFFNDAYDFTEPGPKVGATIGARLKEALGRLPALASPPALACVGLTGKQGWFVREAASAAGITPWEPGLAALSAGLGVKFSDGTVEASFSTASLGLLGLLGARAAAREEWSPAWVEAEAPVEEPPQAPAPVEEPEAEPVAEPVARPVVQPARPKPSLSTEPAAAPGTFSPKTTRPAVAPKSVTAPPVPSQAPRQPAARAPAPPLHAKPPAPPSPSFSAPAPAPHPSFPAPPSPSFPAPASGALPSFPDPASSTSPSFPDPAPGARPSFPAPQPAPRAPSFSNPGFPMPAAPSPEAAAPAPPPAAPQLAFGTRAAAPSGTTPPAPAVTALPFEAVAKLKPAVGPVPEEPAQPKSKVGFYVGVLVVAALVFAAIAVVLEARMERAKANDLEQQEAEAHHVEQQRLKEAEQALKEQADRDQRDLAAAVELTRKQTEEDTRRKVLAEIEAERLAKLPGTLLVATVPAGASVSIDGAAPLTSPVKADQVAPGTHHIQISLAGYEPVQLDREVKGSATTDLGSIALQNIYGTLALTSSPDGLEFAIRAASDPGGKPVRTGRTPATFDDIGHGDYVVTYLRPGCRDHVERVSVEKGAKAQVDTKYTDGSLELTSDPSGASVSKDGAFLGTTPLVLHDLTPKLASFDLTLPGYDPTPIQCEIPEGQTLKYSAQLLRKDRIFKPGEVKTQPESLDAPAPSLSAAQRKAGGDVLLSLVVRRDGSVTDVEVVQASDDDIARRCKMAVERWSFRPATAPDGRTVEARIELPFKFPANSQ